MGRGYQIGAVAKATGLSVDAIRFYEKRRLLNRPARTEGGFRLFTAEQVKSVHFIRRAQELGFSLNEIRELLLLQGEDAACAHVRDVLREKLTAVRNKMAQLRTLESDLSAELRKCERTLKKRAHERDCCPVLEEISQPIRGGRPK